MLYAGQESAATHTPSLFDVDKIEWGDYRLQPYLTRLAKIKKDVALVEGTFTLLAATPAVQAVWDHPSHQLHGIFNVGGASGILDVSLPDGDYRDLLSDASVSVDRGKLPLPESAVVLRHQDRARRRPFVSQLLDFRL